MVLVISAVFVGTEEEAYPFELFQSNFKNKWSDSIWVSFSWFYHSPIQDFIRRFLLT